MAGTATQRAAFRFLREHLHSQDVFTLDEFQTAAGWENTRTFDTYRRKQFKGLIEKVDDASWDGKTSCGPPILMMQTS